MWGGARQVQKVLYNRVWRFWLGREGCEGKSMNRLVFNCNGTMVYDVNTELELLPKIIMGVLYPLAFAKVLIW